MRETRLVFGDLQPRELGFYIDCGILTFPILFHAGTWQSVGTTASIVSTVRSTRHWESTLGSCLGEFWPGHGHSTGRPHAEGIRGNGVGLGHYQGSGNPPSKTTSPENALVSQLVSGGA